MQARNVKDNGNGTFDMEIEHPEFGWIPFTASQDDVEEHGRQLHQKAASGELGQVAPHTPPSPSEILRGKRESASLSRMEFMLALDDAGLLDQIEATVPTLTKRVQIMWHNAQSFDRLYPELVQMAQQLGLTDEQIDAVFGIGGA